MSVFLYLYQDQKLAINSYKGNGDRVTLTKGLFQQIIVPPKVWWKSSLLCKISLIRCKHLALCNLTSYFSWSSHEEGGE